MKRLVPAAAAILVFFLPIAASAQGGLRDPKLPYASWGEALSETAAAIGDRPLVRPADGAYAPGDAVIFDDDGKRYRAHVLRIEGGRYVIQYDGFGPDWTRRVSVDALLGYQPGYTPARAAAPATRPTFAVGDELEAESAGRWREARVIAVRPGQFRVHFDGQPSSADEWVPATRLRVLPGGVVRTAPLATGKYGCTTSQRNSATGMYESSPKGSVVLLAGGRYQYLGFAQPSAGRFRADAAGTITFAGGHLAGGEATPMVGRPGRFYLTAPGIGERWTCGFAAKN